MITEPNYQKVLLKQSQINGGFEDYAEFAKMFEINAEIDKVHLPGKWMEFSYNWHG